MELEETLAIIKPDGVKNAIKIIERLYENDLKIKAYQVKSLDKDVLRVHYAHLVDKPFYKDIENYMTSGEAIVMILEGENAVERLRTLMGPTNSTLAEKGTIRGDFGTDITRNAIHGSDSVENAKIEIERFFDKPLKKEYKNI